MMLRFVLLVLWNTLLVGASRFDTDLWGNQHIVDQSLQHCEPVRVPACEGFYNYTYFPNLLRHSHQYDASASLKQYEPLIKVKCSPYLKRFLCYMFVPICVQNMKGAIPPCRLLCEKARQGCEDIMKKFGFHWPQNLECVKLPESGMCVSHNGTGSITKSPNKGDTTMPPDAVILQQNPSRFECPLQLAVPRDVNYKLYIDERVKKDCGMPCKGKTFFSDWQRRFLHYWILTWSLICSLSTGFTVTTYIIDRTRFQYPERPIIFMAASYFMTAVSYIVAFILGDKVACMGPFAPPKSAEHLSMKDMPLILTQGTLVDGCTVLFMLQYFFFMSSSLWWVLLTLTWLLSAGFKWSSEAINANSQYFHFVAWGLPAVKTIIILAVGDIGGDELSGICHVGIFRKDMLQIFLLAPLFIYLILGVIFLAAGFISLFRIRTIMKHDGTQTDQLEKLMLRIGIFSLLYTVPAIVLIGCALYELHNRDKWMQTWHYQICNRYGPLAFCPKGPALDSSGHPVVPDFGVFCLKYVAVLIVGVTSGVWIWTRKTFYSWSACCRQKVCCREEGEEPAVVGANRERLQLEKGMAL